MSVTYDCPCGLSTTISGTGIKAQEKLATWRRAHDKCPKPTPNTNYVHVCQPCDKCSGCQLECEHRIVATVTSAQNNPKSQDTAELEQAIDDLEREAVDWHEECRRDTAEHGHPLGDAKEMRRARRRVLALIATRDAHLRDAVLAAIGEDEPEPTNWSGSPSRQYENSRANARNSLREELIDAVIAIFRGDGSGGSDE